MKPELKELAEAWTRLYVAAIAGTIPSNNCLSAKSLARRAAAIADAAYRERRLRFDLEETFDPTPRKTEDRDNGGD